MKKYILLGVTALIASCSPPVAETTHPATGAQIEAADANKGTGSYNNMGAPYGYGTGYGYPYRSGSRYHHGGYYGY